MYRREGFWALEILRSVLSRVLSFTFQRKAYRPIHFHRHLYVFNIPCLLIGDCCPHFDIDGLVYYSCLSFSLHHQQPSYPPDINPNKWYPADGLGAIWLCSNQKKYREFFFRICGFYICIFLFFFFTQANHSITCSNYISNLSDLSLSI